MMNLQSQLLKQAFQNDLPRLQSLPGPSLHSFCTQGLRDLLWLSAGLWGRGSAAACQEEALGRAMITLYQAYSNECTLP